MLSFSMPELILILVIALVVFGPSKLPEVGKAIGLSLHEFKKATSEEDKKLIPTTSTNMEVKKPE